MDTPVRLAAVGVGRIGQYHARHIQEISRETGKCELVAVVDRHADTAQTIARELQANQHTPIQAFSHVDLLVESKAAQAAEAGGVQAAEAAGVQAAVIASRTEHHQEDATSLIQAGYRVLLEKPLTDTPETSAQFAQYLSGDARSSKALMQAFQRRFDAPLQHGKRLLDEGVIGRPFKAVSILEDPLPPPVGYQSPGILPDMSVHNIDEVIWLLGRRPHSVSATGANLHNCHISPVSEDFDDAQMTLWFEDDTVAQIQVSRNHVAGYRNETWVYGDRGLLHIGAFTENPYQITVEAIGPEGLIQREYFPLREYDLSAPVFIQRFGDAYKGEVEDFVARCLNEQPFAVTHIDGLSAVLVAYAGSAALQGDGGHVPITYPM